MKHVASIEVLHDEQAMQSWMMPDKIDFFQAWRQALVTMLCGAFQEQKECCCLQLLGKAA